jgi:hypothetical protein
VSNLNGRLKAIENNQPTGPEMDRYRAWLLALYPGQGEGLSNSEILSNLRSQPDDAGIIKTEGESND